MNPMAGFPLQPLPGFSQGVPVLNAPPLPGGQAPHHSHAQPRRQTGEFKKGKAAGKTDLSKLPTAQILKMLSGVK
jgi:hypothetical protein